MAVDTAQKRASCIGFAYPSRLVLPVPDGLAPDRGDRQQLGYCYRGIDATGVFLIAGLRVVAAALITAGPQQAQAIVAGAQGAALAVAGPEQAQTG